ncbi:MAG: class I mannose-6-phosphate isomerase [Chloroflexota bacterium]|nr:class I mannose-6-phosphate isomerase [Chloroflexota bacterium]
MGHAGMLHPLTFEPELKDKIWGGRRLGEVLGKELPPDVPVGESWEVHGGSVVAEGPHTGRTLDEVRGELGAALMGTRLASPPPDVFPLLFKYIDASEYLSVQVHPDDAYAQEHTGYPYGKTESWYIVHAEPGAKLVHGWKRPTTPEEVGAAVRENRLEELMEYVPVSPGDVVFVPAGTVHAIGGGIVLGEIQQNSDTTYRLYDWGRVGFDGKPRDLHVEESLRTLYYGKTEPHKIRPVDVQDGGVTRRFLVACRYFVLESVEGESEFDLPGDGSSFQLLSPLDGPVRLAWSGGEMELERGRTALAPAGLRGCRATADGPYRLLRMYMPDLASDVVGPLSEAGRSREEITALGGDAAHNDVSRVMGDE